MNRPENLKVMSSTDAFIDNPTKVYRKGAIVFPKNGAAISTNKKRILGQDSVVDLNTGGFLADEKLISPFFLYYLMQHIDFKQYVRRGAVPTLDIKELKAKECCIPPVQEQEKIVAELDCLTGIIEKKKQQLKELDKLAQSIFYEMSKETITKVGQVKRLGDVATFVNGYPFKPETWTDKGLPIIRIQNLNNPNAAFNRFSGSIPEKYLVKNGDLLISWSASLGAYEWKGEDAYLNQHIFKVVFNKGPIDKHYLRFAVESKLAEMEKDAHGATMRHIVKKDFDNTIIPFPSLDIQKIFAEKIEAIEKHKALIRRSIAETETLFNSRMDYWFN